MLRDRAIAFGCVNLDERLRTFRIYPVILDIPLGQFSGHVADPFSTGRTVVVAQSDLERYFAVPLDDGAPVLPIGYPDAVLLGVFVRYRHLLVIPQDL